MARKSGLKRRKSYPLEVREKAVKLITELGDCISDVVRKTSCSTSAVRRWKDASTSIER